MPKCCYKTPLNSIGQYLSLDWKVVLRRLDHLLEHLKSPLEPRQINLESKMVKRKCCVKHKSKWQLGPNLA